MQVHYDPQTDTLTITRREARIRADALERFAGQGWALTRPTR